MDRNVHIVGVSSFALLMEAVVIHGQQRSSMSTQPREDLPLSSQYRQELWGSREAMPRYVISAPAWEATSFPVRFCILG